MKKQQVILIHGGLTFKDQETYLNILRSQEFDPVKDLKRQGRWNRSLQDDLGSGYEFIKPTMPNRYASRYEEWEISFKNVLDYAGKGIVLIGHSLGGTFLLKYLTENEVDKNIKQLHLVAPVLSESKEYLEKFVVDVGKISNIKNIYGNTFLYASEDDEVVLFSDSARIKELVPEVNFSIFTDRGHFLQEDFPEIVQKIKELENE
jgi:predicted alpha/beta hydrolase family esterase